MSALLHRTSCLASHGPDEKHITKVTKAYIYLHVTWGLSGGRDE